MAPIVLGHLAKAGDHATLDLQRLVESRALVQANSGAGKSWALRRLLEQTHGRVQHLVLDVEGEFHTLRERYDYVLGARQGGDTLAAPHTAGLLARRLLELGVSAVLDIYELQAFERVRFVRLFLEALINAPRDLWHPALVVIDEAHIFCPEKGSAESASAVIDLMTRGRKRGFCGVLATQRLSKLHKDAAAEANVKLIGRASLDVDMKRAGEELGFYSKEEQLRIRRLETGHFFAFGPGLSDEVAEIVVGPVQTTHPRPGQRATPVPPARENVQRVLAQLADLPKEADEEAKTVAELRAEVSRLKREVVAKPQAAPAPAPKPVEVPILKDAQIKRLEALATGLQEGARRLLESGDHQHNRFKDSVGAFVNASGMLVAQIQAAAAAATHTPTSASGPAGTKSAPGASLAGVVPGGGRGPSATPSPPRPGNGDGRLTGPEQRILDALAWLDSIAPGDHEQTAVAFLAGYTVGGGAFNNPRGALRGKGLIEYRGSDRLALTDAGRAHANVPATPLGPDELQARVLERLPGPETRLLRVLLERYPRGVSNEDLARASGYEPGGGAYNNPRGRLRSLGLIEYRGGEVFARPVLFLEGARG